MSGASETTAEDTVEDAFQRLLRFDQALLANPYVLYQRMQREAPVLRHGPVFYVTRYDDVIAGCRDAGRLSNAGATAKRRHDVPEADLLLFDEYSEFESHLVTRMDGPEHNRLRNLMRLAFTPRRVAALEPMVQQITDELVDGFDPGAEIDFIADFAIKLPLFVITDMLGVAKADRGRVHGWSREIGNVRGNLTYLRSAHQALVEFRSFVHALAESNRRDPSTELMAALIEGEKDDKLSADEIVGAVIILLFGGHETTTNLLGSGTLNLLRHERWSDLVANPDQIPAAIGELLRFDPPIQFVSRVAAVDLEVAGSHVPAGSLVQLGVAAAAHDPTQYESPHKLDFGREGTTDIYFGHGAHYCLGAALGRLEGDVAFRTLTRRFPDLRLSTDTWTWRDNLLLHGVERLPVILGTG